MALMTMDPLEEKLSQIQLQLDAIVETLDRIAGLLVAFTSDGRPLSASTPDPLAIAYLLVASHGLSRSLATDQASVSDVLKGSVVLAESLVREIDTYRSGVQGQALLERLLANGPGA